MSLCSTVPRQCLVFVWWFAIIDEPLSIYFYELKSVVFHSLWVLTNAELKVLITYPNRRYPRMNRKLLKPIPSFQVKDEEPSENYLRLYCTPWSIPERFSRSLVDSSNIQMDRVKRGQENFKEIRLSLPNIIFITNVF